MLQRTCSGTLYNVLEVTKDATPQEIKRAYYRLALRLHPDKTGGTTTEQFKLIQEAQAILSDPKQRRAYDTFGRMGVESLRQFGDAMELLTPAVMRGTIALLAFWMFLLLLTLVLVIVRLDYDKNWYWVVMFIPLWTAFFPLLGIGAYLLLHGTNQREISSVLLGGECLLVIVAAVMLVIGLSGALQWTVAFVPSVLLYVLESYRSLQCLASSQVRSRFADAIDPAIPLWLSRIYWELFLKTVFEKVCGLSFIILVMLRAAQTHDDQEEWKFISFWWVFAPLILYFGAMTFFSAARVFFSESSEMRPGMVGRLCRAAVSSVYYGGLLFMTCMMAAKCEVELNNKRGGLHPSAAVTLFPLQVALAIAVLLPCCMCCFTESLLGDFPSEETTGNGENAPLGGYEASNLGKFTYSRPTPQPVNGEGMRDENVTVSQENDSHR